MGTLDRAAPRFRQNREALGKNFEPLDFFFDFCILITHST